MTAIAAMIAEVSSQKRESSGIENGLIFIVDDEPMIGEIVASILDLEGFRACVFTDPAKALAAFGAANPKPALLLTDYVMPPMNGMELIHRCRTMHPALKTILFSGNVTEDITQIYVFKPDAFMEKPFLPKTLVDLVREVLAR